MAGRKALRVGLALVLVLSTMGLLLTKQVEADEGAPASLDVPSLRIGDSAQYIIHRTEPSLDWTRSELEGVNRRYWNVTGTAVAMDEAGTPYETVVVDAVDQPIQSEGGGASRGLHWVRYFEPSTRSLVQQVGETGVLHDDRLVPTSADLTTIRYGPSFGGFNFPGWDEWRIAVALQGRPLTEGDDYSSWFAEDMDRSMKQISPAAGDMFSMRVGPGGMWDGEPAIAVEIREVLWYPTTRMTDGGRYLENTTWWFVSSKPVPVRIQLDEYGVDGTPGEPAKPWRYRVIQDLVSFTRGTEEVAWGPTLEPLPEQALPDPEWSTKRYPEAGRDSHLSFRIEDAVRAAETDHTKPRFELWKAQNPGWQVVGFYSNAGQVTAGVQFRELAMTAWLLTLSAPFGERIVQLEVRKAGEAVVLGACTCDVPDADAAPTDPVGIFVPPGRRFDPAWLPAQMVTLETAYKFWAALPSEGRDHGSPNWVSWGYDYVEATDGETSLRSLLSGAYYGSFGFDSPSPVNARDDRAFVVLDVGTGKLIGAAVTDAPPLAAVLASPVPPAAGPTTDVPQAAAANPFVPFLAGAASISLLALLLSFLLQPAKQVAIGLYSKLSRDEVLDNTLRDQLVTLIEHNPGISQPSMQAQTGAGWSTLTYHLSVLSSKQLVGSVRDGRHRRYFRSLDQRLILGQAKLANAGTRQIFDMICARPGTDRATLARRSGLARSSVSWHLDRLKEGKLVRTETRGRSVCYFQAAPGPAIPIHPPVRAVAEAG